VHFLPINSVLSELPSISDGGIYKEYTDITRSYKEAKEVLFFSLLLDRLFNDNIITQKLFDNITQLFLYELWGTLFKTIDRTDIDKAEYDKIAQQISDVEQ